jgi:hypothetical protein
MHLRIDKRRNMKRGREGLVPQPFPPYKPFSALFPYSSVSPALPFSLVSSYSALGANKKRMIKKNLPF